MTDKPMIFSAEMVRALLDGRKIQTRRALKPQPPADAHMVRAYTDNAPRPALRNTIGWFVPEAGDLWPCNDGDRIPLRYAPGDRLWVREACRAVEHEDGTDAVEYLADGAVAQIKNCAKAADQWGELYRYGKRGPDRTHRHGQKVPSIHMPRWASRLTLVVTDVRVQRVREISRDDAIAEGCPSTLTAEWHFRDLWNSLYGPDAWDRNDWVVAITFTVHRCNIDQMEAAQ